MREARNGQSGGLKGKPSDHERAWAPKGVSIQGGYNMSGTCSKAGGHDYLLLLMQGKSVGEKIIPA